MSTKLYIAVFCRDTGAAIQRNTNPPVAQDDIVLGAFVNNNPPDYDEFLIKVHGDGDDFTRKQTSNTKRQVFDPIDDTCLAVVEATTGDPIIYCYEPNIDVGPIIINLINEVSSKVMDPSAVKTRCNTITALFTNGGPFIGNFPRDDDTMSGETGLTYVPGNPIVIAAAPVIPPAGAAGAIGATATAVDFAASTEADILRLIETIVPAIVYLGFKPQYIRHVFLKKYTTLPIAVRNLMFCFSAYAYIGNNIAKLQHKRVDVDISKRLMQAVETMGVAKQGQNNDTLTLPRLAIAFMPEYLIYRKVIARDLQDQTESTLAVVYKDIVFYGCKEIRDLAGYADFHKEFSSFIMHGQKKEIADMTDAKVKSTYERWNKVSVNGYKADAQIHTRMATAISATLWSKSQAFNFMSQGMTAYAPPP
jgi:hypothetical protein